MSVGNPIMCKWCGITYVHKHPPTPCPRPGQCLLIADLERDAIRHDKCAERHEEEARDFRRLADRARKGAEYLRKSALTATKA